MRTLEELAQAWVELDHDMEKFIQRYEDSEGFGALVGKMLRDTATWYTNRALDQVIDRLEANPNGKMRETVERLRVDITPNRIKVQ